MANLLEVNSEGDGLAGALLFVSQVAPDLPSPDPTLVARYAFANLSFPTYDSLVLNGVGFTYNDAGVLMGGTITSSALVYHTTVPGPPQISREEYSGIALPVQQAYAIAQAGPQSLARVLLSGSDTIEAISSFVFGYTGNDTITVYGRGGDQSNTVFVTGTRGADTVVLPSTLRGQGQFFSGGGNQSLNITAGSAGATLPLFVIMTGVASVRFIDGTDYETDQLPGAQAALIFEGIFGRLPDPVNAGGFARIAQQQGTAAAADAMLTTAEAKSSAASLGSAAYVTRLYQNILGRAPDPAALSGLQTAIDAGYLTRAQVAAQVGGSAEAQTVNFSAFASHAVFAADPMAVDVLRAYEVLLNRAPEASSLIADTRALAGGTPLGTLYASIQASPEFASKTHPYGITATTPASQVATVVVSDPISALIRPLVTSTSGIFTLPG